MRGLSRRRVARKVGARGISGINDAVTEEGLFSSTATVTFADNYSRLIRYFAVFRHDHQGLGRLVALPVTSLRVARYRGQTWRREHFKRGYSLGARPSVRRSRIDRYVSPILVHIYLSLMHFVPPGTRMGLSAHTEDNRRTFTFSLTDKDAQEIEAVLDQSSGRKLITTIGDSGAEYR